MPRFAGFFCTLTQPKCFFGIYIAKHNFEREHMKKILVFLAGLFVLTLASCSLENDQNTQFHIEFLPVETVTMPESVARGQTYPITVTFRRPDDCHYFDSFYYLAEESVRTVAVQSIVIENATCDPLLDAPAEQQTFNFYCAPNYEHSNYTFKFYKGVDAQGHDVFEEHTVGIYE